MLSLMKENPLFFLSKAISKENRALLSSSVQNNIEEEKTINARVNIFVIDDFKNNTEKYKYSLITNNAKYDYYPVGPINFKSGDSITVKGYLLDDQFVSHTKDIIKKNNARLASTNQPIDSVGNQRTLVFLVKDFSNYSEPFTPAQTKTLVFDGQFKRFMNEQSNGKISFSVDAYGWYTLNRNSTSNLDNGFCDLLTDDELYSMVNKYKVNLANYDRVVYLMSDYAGGCSYVGKSSYDIGGVTYNLSITKVGLSGYKQIIGEQSSFTWSYLDQVLSHEIGHALGLLHANGWACIKDALFGDCLDLEYGNLFDIMGDSSRTLHFNAYYKDQLGWLSPDQVINVDSSGTYEISPQENGSKARLIKINISNITQYALEMRAPFGFDAIIGSPGLVSNTSGLFVNKIGIVTPNKTSLIDMSPNNNLANNDESWKLSTASVTLNSPESNTSLKQLLDPASGITIGPLVSVNKNTSNSSLSSIKLNISIDKTQCKRFVPDVSFKEYSYPALSAGDYFGGNLFIKNTDYPVCGESQFSIEPIEYPTDWKSYIYPNKLSILPNLSDSSTLGFPIPSDAYTGDYKIKIEVKNLTSGLSKIVESTFHVNGQPVPIKLLPWTAPSLVKSGSTVPFVLNFQGGPTQYDQTITLHFFDKDGIIKFNKDINPSISTTKWSGEISVPDSINIPGDVPVGSYKVTAGLYSTIQSKRTLASPYETEIGTLVVVPESVKLVDEFKNANFIIKTATVNTSIPIKQLKTPTQITILPWSGPSSTISNSSVSFNLLFRGGPTQAEERIFVHFIDKDGNIKFVSDVVPSVPTTKWSGIVSFPVIASVPSDIPSGDYSVVAGLYSGNSRLALNPGSGVVAVSGDRYQVGKLIISKSASGSSLISTASVINANTIRSGSYASAPVSSTKSSQYSSPTPTPTPTPTPSSSPSPIISSSSSSHGSSIVSSPEPVVSVPVVPVSVPQAPSAPIVSPESVPTPIQVSVPVPESSPAPSPTVSSDSM